MADKIMNCDLCVIGAGGLELVAGGLGSAITFGYTTGISIAKYLSKV